MNQRLHPSKIPTETIQEIIVRQLINLPKEEKEFPRIMNQIEEACWTFMDQDRSSRMEKTQEKKYQLKFAERIFKEWSYLAPHQYKLKLLWDEFKNYKSKIPSYGAVIFNQNLDQILFVIYKNPRDKIVNKLDFAKGKVDQGESPKECALREIYEETQLNLKDKMNENQNVKIETIENRMVQLFFVDGIDSDSINQPVNHKEVDALVWVSVREYVLEVLRQNTVDYVLAPNQQSKYCTFLVKNFAYYVSEWQHLRKNNQLQSSDIYERVSVRDSDLFNYSQKGKQIIEQVCSSNSNRDRNFEELFKNLPYFLLGFCYHHVLENLEMAEKLYEEAFRRAEFTRGCFHMLLSIQIHRYTFKKDQLDFEGFKQKLKNLESMFGHFLQHDQRLMSSLKRVQDHADMLQMGYITPNRLSKEVLILDIRNLYHTSNLQKLSEPVEQFKAKFQTLKELKFDPFAVKIQIVGWPKKSVNSFQFYSSNYQNLSRKQYSNMAEHAIIETTNDKEAIFIKSLLGNKQMFSALVSDYEVQLDEMALNLNDNFIAPPPQYGQEIRKYVVKKPSLFTEAPAVQNNSFIQSCVHQILGNLRKQIQMPTTVERDRNNQKRFRYRNENDFNVGQNNFAEERDNSFERKLNQIQESFKLQF